MNVLNNKDTKKIMFNTLNNVFNTLKYSLGPNKSNVIINRFYDCPLITNDGLTIIESINSKNKYQKAIINILKDGAIKTNEKVGDGTTTTLLFTIKLYQESSRLLNNSYNIFKIEKHLKESINFLINELIKNKSNCTTVDEIEKIAKLSSNNAVISSIIKSIYQNKFENPHIVLNESNFTSTELEFKYGYEIDSDLLNEYVKTNNDIHLKKCNILITDNNIDSLEDLSTILNDCHIKEESLFIIASHFSEDVINILTGYRLKKIIDVYIIKNPNYGDEKEELLVDISNICNTSIISDSFNLKLDNLTLDDLNKVDSIIIKDSKIIIKNDFNIDTYINSLKKLRFEEDFRQDILNRRIAKLENKIAIINIGGFTASEKQNLKLRFEDSICAVKSSIDNGIIYGGSSNYIKLVELLKVRYKKAIDKHEKVALKILINSLPITFYQMLDNSKITNKKAIVKKIRKNKTLIYDIENDKFEEKVKSLLIEPIDVFISSFENSVSLLSLLLGTKSIILEEEYQIKEEELFN